MMPVSRRQVQWPVLEDCTTCHRVTLPRHGAKATVAWDRAAVKHQLSVSYCLEPAFECWEVGSVHEWAVT